MILTSSYGLHLIFFIAVVLITNLADELFNNIFNRFYESNGYSYSERYYSGGEKTDTYTYNYYYPQAGINMLGGLSVRF